MKSQIAELLICLRCLPTETGLSLNARERDGVEVVSGNLRCPRCRTDYPIAGGIAMLLPQPQDPVRNTTMQYEAPEAVSSYLWSHYADLMGDEEATGAYLEWAALVSSENGMGLDAGCAVGRFTFELSRKCKFAVGFDYSRSFIAVARELLMERRLNFPLKQEGHLFEQCTIRLPAAWDSNRIEFIMADAQAIPFRSHLFSQVASLNLVDKLPKPFHHLTEMNRIALMRGAQFLIADPFSWSAAWAKEEDWLGGTRYGRFAGNGQDNLRAILEGRTGELSPPWTVTKHGSIWWKIRNHRNHFELIRSRFIQASR